MAVITSKNVRWCALLYFAQGQVSSVIGKCRAANVDIIQKCYKAIYALGYRSVKAVETIWDRIGQNQKLPMKVDSC